MIHEMKEFHNVLFRGRFDYGMRISLEDGYYKPLEDDLTVQ